MTNEDTGYPASDSVIEEQMELRIRFAETVIHHRTFSFTLASSHKEVTGRVTKHRTGGEAGPTALVIQIILDDGTKTSVYLPDLESEDPAVAHFFAYAGSE